MMSSNEVKKKTFQPAFRGYDRAEVDAFLADIAETLLKLETANEALQLRLGKAEAELQEKITNEDAIRRALVDSQTAAAQVVEAARRKGEEIEALTREKCGQVLAEFREKIREERERLHTLRAETAHFKSRIYELYQNHIEVVEGISKQIDEPDWDMNPTDATRTVLALLRGEFDRRTRIDEIEEEKLDSDIDVLISRLSKTTPSTDPQ